MKNRNFLSIDYNNNYNFSTQKLILRPFNRYFHQQKTYSNLHNYNNNIINLKSSFGKNISIPDNNRYKTLFISSKDQNSNLSKRNTYYKTKNNFSPQSTISVFSSKYSFNKEKHKKNINSQNKNSPISLKKIEFSKDINNFSRNNFLQSNNTRYIFVGNKDPPKKEIKQIKNNIEHNIELSGQNLINSTINNSVKSKNKKTMMINKTDINNSIDFFSYPNFKLTKKSKSNKILNNKRQKEKNNFLKFNNNNIINVKKPLEEYDEKISEYNFDNYKIDNNQKQASNTLCLNVDKNKKIIVELKTRKNTDNNEIIIKEIINTKNNQEKKEEKKNSKKIKNFELEADIRMFDPITLKSNENLSRDFLIQKEKEKFIIKKLFDNEQLNKLLFNFSNNTNEENKSSETKIIEDKEKNKKEKKDKPYSFFKKNTKAIKSLKINSMKKFNDMFKNFFNREFLKPSEYVNYIANKIFRDIDTFRHKRYKDNDNKDGIIDESYSDLMNIFENKDLSEEKITNHHIFYKNSKKERKIHTFHFQPNLNIKNDKNIKNSNSTSFIKNNTIQKIIRSDEIKKSINDKNSKEIQTQNNNINEQENEKNFNEENELNENNKIKSLKKKIINKKEMKIINKKIKSNSKRKKIPKKRWKKLRKNNKSEEKKEENKENAEVPKNEENIENEDIEEEKEEEKDIYEDNIDDNIDYDNSDYINSSRKKDKSKTLINRNRKLKFSNIFNKNLKTNEEEDEKAEVEPIIEKNKIEEILDDFYEFKDYKIANDYIILDEFDKINIDSQLRIKLKENMKQLLTLIKKNPKTKYEYIKLHLCQKRIKYIIKKLAEKDTKKHLVDKTQKNLTFPEDIEERKALYKLMRVIEDQIREELRKTEEYKYEESDSSDNSMENKNIYEFLPLDEEVERQSKKSMFDSPKKRKKELIYDNLYLYKNGEDEQPVQIKKEVYDILNKENINENEEKKEEREVERRSPSRFTIRRRKFKKTRKISMLSKLRKNDDEIEKKEVITLDDKINDFFEKIRRLKGTVDEVDYDKILNELLWSKKGDNLMEENIIKEIRLLNFFKYFQTVRKMDILGKKYFRNKYSFNSPLNFKNNQK